MPIQTIYRPDEGPQLELATNRQLIYQLRTLRAVLPITYAAQIAIMQVAADRIETMHADYVSNGPVTDEERRLS